MAANCIVTGYDAQGKSCVISAGPIKGDESFTHIPGFVAAPFWKTGANPTVGSNPANPLAFVESVLPEVGGTTAMFVTFPPEDPNAAPPTTEEVQLMIAERAAKLPGLASEFEEDGFHATNTIDYGVLLEGELTLLLDTGAPQVIKAGDVVIQMGTRHAWRNTGNKPARVMFVMIGAERK